MKYMLKNCGKPKNIKNHKKYIYKKNVKSKFQCLTTGFWNFYFFEILSYLYSDVKWNLIFGYFCCVICNENEESAKKTNWFCLSFAK